MESRWKQVPAICGKVRGRCGGRSGLDAETILMLMMRRSRLKSIRLVGRGHRSGAGGASDDHRL